MKALFQWRQATKDQNHQNKEINLFLRTEALLPAVFLFLDACSLAGRSISRIIFSNKEINGGGKVQLFFSLKIFNLKNSILGS